MRGKCATTEFGIILLAPRQIFTEKPYREQLKPVWRMLRCLPHINMAIFLMPASCLLLLRSVTAGTEAVFHLAPNQGLACKSWELAAQVQKQLRSMEHINAGCGSPETRIRDVIRKQIHLGWLTGHLAGAKQGTCFRGSRNSYIFKMWHPKDNHFSYLITLTCPLLIAPRSFPIKKVLSVLD